MEDTLKKCKTTSKKMKVEDDLNLFLEIKDDLNFLTLEDDLNFLNMEDDLIVI